jgi:hypothetical protein
MAYEYGDWIQLAESKFPWLNYLTRWRNSGRHNNREFLDQLSNYELLTDFLCNGVS